MSADPRARREQLLERQMARLERRVAKLQTVSERISWLRVAVALAALILSYLGFAFVHAPIGWAIALLSLFAFAFVVARHRRLEERIDLLNMARELKADQVARLSLDWANLRGPASLDLGERRGLALDLDLTGPRSLHQLIDTTISHCGSQLLADWLVQPKPDLKSTLARQQIVRELAPLARFRDRFHLVFQRVLRERLEGEALISWLSVPMPGGQLKWVLPLIVLWAVLNFVLLAFSIVAGWPDYWIISATLYFVFYLINQGSTSAFLEALERLDTELGLLAAILRYLETHDYRSTPNLARLCAPFRDPRRAPSKEVRRIKLAATGVSLRSNFFLGLVLNLALPWDFLIAWLASRYRAEIAATLPVWVERIHELDALIALGDLAGLNPEYSFPEFDAGARPVFQAAQIGHPLIPSRRQVRNDFLIQNVGEVAIITGSNMAGKSTFLKTIGANLCLAYAGAPVDARFLRTIPFRICTCIRITDSIVDGFSYFYAEVKCLKGLLNELMRDDSLPLLYLIDEIFRGTNNRERLLGSQAYLRAVAGKHGAGLLATHDLELAGLAEHSPYLLNYHFQDDVLNGELVFDYRIRPGPSPTTNALRIMQMEGLPV